MHACALPAPTDNNACCCPLFRRAARASATRRPRRSAARTGAARSTPMPPSPSSLTATRSEALVARLDGGCSGGCQELPAASDISGGCQEPLHWAQEGWPVSCTGQLTEPWLPAAQGGPSSCVQLLWGCLGLLCGRGIGVVACCVPCGRQQGVAVRWTEGCLCLMRDRGLIGCHDASG
jgi:hypothetical protein